MTALEAAIRTIYGDALATWDPPEREVLLALPFQSSDEPTRADLRNRVRSICGSLAERAYAGERPDQLRLRTERAVTKILRLDSVLR